ncbi:MAG TPA: VWA domain-containing protein [Pyrinomonadaceae bacterium]|nr:VWA domain-containing protein [Pyrinomonadaceae bacterium]
MNSDPTDESLEQELEKQFPSARSAAERQSVLELTRGLTRLPLNISTAILETSAAIGGGSLRAALEFLRAAPAAAEVLEVEELRAWGEMGRRLAMGDVETSISFFIAGVEDLRDVPRSAHPLLFQACTRQMTLSAANATDTLRRARQLSASLDDPRVLNTVLEIAAEIARRSAKHSSDFLAATPDVVAALRKFADPAVLEQAFQLASAFAFRAGGMAADAWSAIPTALGNLDDKNALRLIASTDDFLERGGGGALNLMLAGGEMLRLAPGLFSDWIELLRVVAQHGNASLVAFVRASPRFVRGFFSDQKSADSISLMKRVIALTREIAGVDGEAALACFRSSPGVLRTVAIEQFAEWAQNGLATTRNDARARRSYFALETRSSYAVLHSGSAGLSLDAVKEVLRLYVEALTGQVIEIAPIAAVPMETRIGDGKTIHLPSLVAEFGDADLDFRLYKVLAAHAAGQIEFGTYQRNTSGLSAAFAAISATYDPENAGEQDAFALNGYLSDLPATAGSGEAATAAPNDFDYSAVLRLFPDPPLAQRIFGTLENGRIDYQLRHKYRGLARDLDLVREHLRPTRPKITDLPATLLPFEILFQITMLGGALADARQFYGQIVSELETIFAEYLTSPAATVADTLMATRRAYQLFQSVVPTDDSVQQLEVEKEPAESDRESSMISESLRNRRDDRQPQRRDARDLFNAWNDPNAEGDPDNLEGGDAWIEGESAELELQEGEVAYNYDEWDRELTDHRLGWCRVIEKKVKHGDRSFVDDTRERHRGVISSIRYQFQLMKPEELTRVANEIDGEEYDLNAVVDYVLDRRAAKVGGGHQSERLYTKRLRRRRDVAVSFLLDQSSSTARTIGRHPLQPYTHPGRRIIEIEKEGLVLMSEALEAVGDVYAIHGFTSEGRRNVKFYVVKDFSERYSDEVKQRIGGITYQNNTRLGAAIRHATAKLANQQARTRLLIVLSDGRPYDHDYGDARYAREDTREALRQAKIQGITPFCITIDRESESELKDLYGEIGYTIIDDVLSLPERLPGIYRRLTT